MRRGSTSEHNRPLTFGIFISCWGIAVESLKPNRETAEDGERLSTLEMSGSSTCDGWRFKRPWRESSARGSPRKGLGIKNDKRCNNQNNVHNSLQENLREAVNFMRLKGNFIDMGTKLHAAQASSPWNRLDANNKLHSRRSSFPLATLSSRAGSSIATFQTPAAALLYRRRNFK